MVATATKREATEASERPMDSFTLVDLRALSMDATSEFHRGLRAKALQERYTKLRNEEVRAIEGVPDAEREFKAPTDDCIDLIELANQHWCMTVDDIPPEHYERGEFFSAIRKALKAGDLIYVTDTKRRTWTEMLVAFGIQGRNVRAKILRTVKLPPAPEARKYDLPDGTELRFDERDQTWSGWALKPREIRLVPPMADERACAEELRGHARFRGDNPVRYYP